MPDATVTARAIYYEATSDGLVGHAVVDTGNIYSLLLFRMQPSTAQRKLESGCLPLRPNQRFVIGKCVGHVKDSNDTQHPLFTVPALGLRERRQVPRYTVNQLNDEIAAARERSTGGDLVRVGGFALTGVAA